MLNQHVEICNHFGMHARPSARFAALAQKFECDVSLRCNDLEVNGKSIMGLMMLAASQGCDLCIITQGEDEVDALKALCELVSHRFGEER